MTRRLFGVVAFTAATVMLTGCATLNLYQTARTAPPGKFEFGGAVTPLLATFGDEATFLFFPFPELHARMGLNPNLDIGARWAFGPGMGLDAKYQFLKGRLDGAIQGEGTFYGMAAEGASFALVTLTPRLILSSEPETGLPFAANAGMTYSGVLAGAGGESGSGSMLSLVGGFGLPFRIGATRVVRLMPELGFGIPLLVTIEGETETISRHASVSAGIGVTYVGREEE